jgi:hypothetical protein
VSLGTGFLGGRGTKGIYEMVIRNACV